MVSIERIVQIICFQGDVFDFLNQAKTKINAKNRIAKGLAAFKNSFAPVTVVAESITLRNVAFAKQWCQMTATNF